MMQPAAVKYLLERTEIDKSKIGLAGHSEGGLIAPIVASQSGQVAFIVSLAGPGVKGYDIIVKQNRDISQAVRIVRSGDKRKHTRSYENI